jgi:small acid-soluble spore protein A (major alpha-type SASP)
MTNLTIDQVLEQLKVETAMEMGIELGANTSARLNGAVGGRVTQKLIELGKQSLLEQSINTPVIAHYNLNQESTPQNQLH